MKKKQRFAQHALAGWVLHPYRELARHRIYVEHVIRCLKIFWILAQPYAAHYRAYRLKVLLRKTLARMRRSQCSEGRRWHIRAVMRRPSSAKQTKKAKLSASSSPI